MPPKRRNLSRKFKSSARKDKHKSGPDSMTKVYLIVALLVSPLPARDAKARDSVYLGTMSKYLRKIRTLYLLRKSYVDQVDQFDLHFGSLRNKNGLQRYVKGHSSHVLIPANFRRNYDVRDSPNANFRIRSCEFSHSHLRKLAFAPAKTRT